LIVSEGCQNELVQLAGGLRAWLIANAEKAPCDANGYRLKGWNTDAALRPYAQARAAVEGAVRFVGLRMDAAPGLAALDLDDTLNDAGGHIDPVAATIWGHWPSYTEITPSRRGLRIWWRVEPQTGEPVTVQTRDNCELAVYDPATGQLKPKPMRFGRELYYRAVRFLIVTECPYQWYPNATSKLATITPGDLADIAHVVRDGRMHDALDGEPETGKPAPAVVEPMPVAQVAGLAGARGSKPKYVKRILRWIATQREGNRNNATYWAAHRLREAGVTLEHAQALLVPLAVALGLPAREAERTTASAYRGGRGT
jgi:hypothetical protein